MWLKHSEGIYQRFPVTPSPLSLRFAFHGKMRHVCPAAAAFWRSVILCILSIFSLMQLRLGTVNICISRLFFSRRRLSVRVQGADTVSFQAVAPRSGWALKQGPSVSPTLYSGDGKVKSHLMEGERIIFFKPSVCGNRQAHAAIGFHNKLPVGVSWGDLWLRLLEWISESLHHNEGLGELSCAQWSTADQHAPAGSCVRCINRFYPSIIF